MLRPIQDNSTSKIFQELSTSKEIDTSEFDQLFLFIKKNKAIPQFLSSIHDNINPNLLLNAIQSGDATSPIFQHRDCHLYLLHLIKEKQIPYWQGMTVYIYIMCLMQFTSKQKLSDAEEVNKMLRNFSIIKLCESNELTDEGESFIKHIAKIPELYGQDQPYWEDKLTNYVLSLPVTEQWLFKIPYTCVLDVNADLEPGYYFDGLIVQLEKANIPFIQWKSVDESSLEKCIYLPSLSVINFILQSISPNFMQILTCFGSISEKTLLELHKQNKHPLMLYSPHVKSNTINAHGGECGPVGVIVHDLIHTFWAGLLPNEFKNSILTFLIPRLLELKSDIQQHNDTNVSSLIDNIITMLNDFDLLKAGPSKMEKRCNEYLQLGCIKFHSESNCTKASMQRIGDNVFQKLYLLIEIIRIKNDFPNEEAKNIWQDFCRAFQDFLNDKHINKKVLKGLQTLAVNINEGQKFISSQTEYDGRINIKDWIKMLNTESIKNVWNRAKKEKHDELLMLITDHDFIFFPPYVEMNNEMRNQLRHFLQHQESHCKNLKTSVGKTLSI